MITVAISKGRILGSINKLLLNCSIKILDSNERSLILQTSDPDIRLIVVRTSDVPTYVRRAAADAGIVGSDVLNENGLDNLYQVLDLKISRCKLVVACPEGFDYQRNVYNGGRLRVATKYPNQTKNFFDSKGMHIDLVKLYGSMELAPLVGLADVIVDLVSTGNTLKANNLVAVEKISDVSAQLIINQTVFKTRHYEIKSLIEIFRNAIAKLPPER